MTLRAIHKSWDGNAGVDASAVGPMFGCKLWLESDDLKAAPSEEVARNSDLIQLKPWASFENDNGNDLVVNLCI